MLLGNGASELVDLLIRIIKNKQEGKLSFLSASETQYLEYERSCLNYGFTKINSFDTNLICIINPCNPTGEYKSCIEMMEYIDVNVKDNTFIIIDESMQPWVGEHFRTDSMAQQYEYIQNKAKNNNINIFIIHSWTKFFSCTGLRIGSLICPTENLYKTLLSHQTPWSCNILALKYLDVCLNDSKYHNDTWKYTKEYRLNQYNYFTSIGCDCYGKDFLSWLWVDFKNENIAEIIYQLCRAKGFPVRWGKGGYNKPTFIRFAVRKPNLFENIKTIINKVCSITNIKKENIVFEKALIQVNTLLKHEHIIQEKFEKLYTYITNVLNQTKNTFTIPSIIVDKNTNIILDGHHRVSLFEVLGIEYIPVSYVDYQNENITVFCDNTCNETIEKKQIIIKANNKDLYQPKSTCHMVYNNDEKIYNHISVLSYYKQIIMK